MDTPNRYLALAGVVVDYHHDEGGSDVVLHVVAGKGIKGFVARPGQQARSVSPTKRKQQSLVKVTVGNKKMMAQEGIPVSQTVDDYMREMEVGLPVLCACAWLGSCAGLSAGWYALFGA